MKTKFLYLILLITGITLAYPAIAEDETRNVPSFTAIALSVSGKLYVEQGDKQSVEIVAKPSVLEDIITEVKNDKLIIRFPQRNFFRNSFDPGKIEIFITMPKIEGLSISGSGDIIAENKISARELDLAISGSGDITLEELAAENIKASVSGSGDISINDGGTAESFTVAVSGSGGVKAENFDATDVNVRISGSGNCTVSSHGSLTVRIAGSGSVYYNGNPNVDSSVAGSGKVKKM